MARLVRRVVIWIDFPWNSKCRRSDCSMVLQEAVDCKYGAAAEKDGESDAERLGAIKAGKPRVSGGGVPFYPATWEACSPTSYPLCPWLICCWVALSVLEQQAVLGHFSVMVKDISQLFVAGPPW